MIEIDFDNYTYVCPYCGCKQSFNDNNLSREAAGYERYFNSRLKEKDIDIFHIKCTNKECSKITVVARDAATKKQFDIYLF